MNVVTPKIYELIQVPPDPHQRMFTPEGSMVLGARLWLHSNRASSLGSYIGTFSLVWEENGWIGPKGQTFTMMMDYARPIIMPGKD